MGSIDTVNSPYIRYSLTSDEKIQGCVLSFLQLQILNNEKASVAEQLLSLAVDDSLPLGCSFIKNHAYLNGQLALLTNLIERSQAAERALNRGSNSGNVNVFPI